MKAVPELHIGRLHSRFVSSRALDDEQVRQWHEALGEQDPAELVGRVVAEDEWLLIRHLPLQLRWRPERTAPEVGRVWLQALQAAVEQAASHEDPANVLRYRLWRHGLADLVYRSALGEVNRQWAWQRMALISREGLAASEALVQGAKVLAGEPELVWPVLHHWLQAEADTGALTAVARRVPLALWQQWLAAAPQSRHLMALASARDGALHEPHASPSPAHGSLPAALTEAPPLAMSGVQHLLQWVRRHPPLAQHLGEVLTVWVAACAWPHGVDQAEGPQAAGRLSTARRWWRQAAHDAVAAPSRQTSRQPARLEAASQALARSHPDESGAPGQAPHLPVSPSEQVERPDVPVAARDNLAPAPALPEPDTTVHTAWAGALFWLRHLSAPGALEPLQAHAEHRTVGACMQAVAQALGVPDDDPVMMVFTAGAPLQQLPPAMQAAALGLVSSWAQWLDDTLPDAPAPRLMWVCQRPGRLKLEPGWIELHLDLDRVDTRLRRIGLDLDPGWVPLIGAVVRVRYD